MSLCLMIAVTNLLDLAWSAVLLPVWAHDSGAGVGALGLIFAVWGGASMLGSLVAAAYGTRLPRFTTYVVAFLITGLPRFVLFALGVPLWAILAMCVVGGCASGFLNPVLGAVRVRADPPRPRRSGDRPEQRDLLVADAARRHPRRRARHRDRPRPGAARGRALLLRGDHGAGFLLRASARWTGRSSARGRPV